MRKSLYIVMVAALALIPAFGHGQQLEFKGMTPGERAIFGAEVRSYLLQNPEVIFEAIQILEERRSRAAETADRDLIERHAAAIYEDGFSFVGGNQDGDITLVEFLDYRCGYCKRAHPEVQELLDRDPNVRLIVKEFPILGPDSVAAGRMALAALAIDPSKYEDLGDALMTYNGNLTEQVAYKIAGSLGYNIAELKVRAGGEVVAAQLEQNYKLAQALGVQGTPAFIVGSEVIRGYLPVDDMLGAVNEARRQQGG